MNSRRFLKRDRFGNTGAEVRFRILRSLLTITLMTAVLTALPAEPGRFDSRLAQGPLPNCPTRFQLSTSPLRPHDIERVMVPRADDSTTSALYFVHGVGRGLPVFAPAAGRVLQLESITTRVDGRERFHYSVHIAPCDGTTLRVHHIDLLSEELAARLRDIEQDDCRYAGPDRQTVVCSVRPNEPLALQAGDVLGHSVGGLVGLEWSSSSLPGDRLSLFIEPLRSLLRDKLEELEEPRIGLGSSCKAGNDCLNQVGAWTDG